MELLNFEKKVIAGKILNERGFDSMKLLEEKHKIVDSRKDQIRLYEDPNLQTPFNCLSFWVHRRIPRL